MSLMIGVVGFGLQLLIGIGISRTLGAHGYGVYSFSLLVASVLIIPVDSGIATFLLRKSSINAYNREYEKFSENLLHGLVLTLLVTLIAMALVWLTGEMGGGFGGKLVALRHVLPIILILALTKITLSAVYSVQKVNKGQIVTMIVQPVVILAGVAWLFIAGASQHPRTQPENMLWVQLFAGVVVLFANLWLFSEFLTRLSARDAWQNFHLKDMKGIVLLTITGGIGWLTAQTDMLLMGIYMSPAELGIYKIAATAASVTNFSLVAANTILAPVIANYYSEKKFEEIEKIMKISVIFTTSIVVLTGVVIIFFGKVIINFLFGAEFGFAYYPMLILIFGQLVNCASGSVGVVLNMTGHEAHALRGTAVSGVFNIIVCVLLIPRWGAIGASIASASSLILWNAIMLHLARRKVGLRISLLSLWIK